ncbi:hypothetical protein CRUP_010910 [Coryphaenoides rupestris]|nr:hypothetical protein CRUP_010910 [Coryphaenoides rupestris]
MAANATQPRGRVTAQQGSSEHTATPPAPLAATVATVPWWPCVCRGPTVTRCLAAVCVAPGGEERTAATAAPQAGSVQTAPTAVTATTELCVSRCLETVAVVWAGAANTVTKSVSGAPSARAAPGCVTVRRTRHVTRPPGGVCVPQGKPEPDVTSTARPTSTDRTVRRAASVTTGRTVTIETAAAPASRVGSGSRVKKVDPYASQREAAEETHWRRTPYSSSGDFGQD